MTNRLKLIFGREGLDKMQYDEMLINLKNKVEERISNFPY